MYVAVLEIANEIGNLLEKLNALTGLAYTERMQGDLKAAEADYRAALALASEVGKRYPVSLDLAEVLAAEGRIADSRTLGEQALEDSRQANEKESIGLSEAVLAHAFALEGKFPDAIARYNEAVRILREVHEPAALGATLLDLGDTQMEQGDVAGARKSYEEVRDLDRQIPGGFAGPEIEMALARLSLAAGQAEDAAARARIALNKFTAAGREGDRLQAAALLTRALIARGNVAEASGVLAQIASPAGKSFPIEAVIQFRIAGCFVAANAGRRAEAGRAMDAIVAEVSRLGLPRLEQETRLARAAVMKIANHSEAASPH